MMQSSTTPNRPDPLLLLPPRARHRQGRHHEPRFCRSVVAPPAVADAALGAFAGVRSIAPSPVATFARKRGTFIFLSAKTGTTQEGEGPGEYALAKELETSPLVPQYQMHGSELAFHGAEGAAGRRYRPDAVYWSFETGLTMAEVKATEAWFGLPDVRMLADRSRQGLASVGIAYAEVSHDALREDRRRAFNVARAFADRTTAFSRAQRDDVLSLLGGGCATFGRVAEALRVPATAALQTLNGLMVRGHVAYDLSTRIDRDMQVAAASEPPADMPDIRRIGL